MFINKAKKLNKRGFTLVELTIVMAISAIISVMIVSFAVLISAQVKKNNLRADFLESVITLRTDLQKQFALADNGNIENNLPSFDKEDYEYIDNVNFTMQENGKILKVVVSNQKLGETQSFVLRSPIASSVSVQNHSVFPANGMTLMEVGFIAYEAGD